MRAAAYVLNVYCDAWPREHPEGVRRPYAQFTGLTERDAVTAATRAGWFLSADGAHDRCPRCVIGERRRPPPYPTQK